MLNINLLQIIVIILAIPILVFEIAMFVDLIKNKNLTQKQKYIWGASMILLHPFVAIYYYFTARK